MTIGIIMAEVAVLEIHMDRNHVGSMNPRISLHTGETMDHASGTPRKQVHPSFKGALLHTGETMDHASGTPRKQVHLLKVHYYIRERPWTMHQAHQEDKSIS